jgi:uncharacterized protein YjeT (DUF2065 family)
VAEKCCGEREGILALVFAVVLVVVLEGLFHQNSRQKLKKSIDFY